MLIVFLTNRKDYEPFLADVVFVFDGLENFGIISHELARICFIADFTDYSDFGLVNGNWLGIAERDGRELGTNWHLSGLLFYWPAAESIDFLN